jgi:hypothetical protein
MTYRIPHYLREVKRRLEDLTYQDWVSRLAVVIGAIGVIVIGVLLVEALFRLVALLIVLGALGFCGRLWWLHRAMPTAAPRKNTVGTAIEGEYVVIEKRRATLRKHTPSKKRNFRRSRNRIDRYGKEKYKILVNSFN